MMSADAKKWSKVAVLAAVVMVLAGCGQGHEGHAGASPRPSSSQAVGAPNPSEPITELVADADLLVFGTVESVDVPVADDGSQDFPAQTAVVRVDEVLQGEAPAEITVSKPEGTNYFLSDRLPDSYEGRHQGVFTLKATGDSSYVLFGYVGVHDDWGAWQKFERVLGGLPEQAPDATEAELSEWAAQADIIVFAMMRGTEEGITVRTPRVDFSTTGTLSPIEVLKGEMSEPLDVVLGPQPEIPGGTWAFPVTSEGQAGVFYIDTSSGTPTVLNTSSPSALNPDNVPID